MAEIAIEQNTGAKAADSDVVVLLKKQLFYTRVTSCAVIVLFLAILVVALTVLPGVNRAVGEAQVLIGQAERTLDALEGADEIMVNISKVTKELAEADLTGSLEEMDKLIARSQTAMELAVARIDEMDIETLNQAIRDLDAIVSPLADLFGK